MSCAPKKPIIAIGRGGYHTPRSPEELRDAHNAKMAEKVKRRADMHAVLNDPERLAGLRSANGASIATGNRWGGPHKNDRVAARRLGKRQ